MLVIDPMTRINDELEDEWHCPHCKGNDLVDYGDNFDCIKCQLEFNKDDVKQLDKDEVLSLQEKKSLRLFFWSACF